MLKSGNMCGNLRYSWGLLSALVLVAQNLCIKPKKWRLNPFVKIVMAPCGFTFGTTLFFHTCRVRVFQNSLRQRKDGFLQYSNLQAFFVHFSYDFRSCSGQEGPIRGSFSAGTAAQWAKTYPDQKRAFLAFAHKNLSDKQETMQPRICSPGVRLADVAVSKKWKKIRLWICFKAIPFFCKQARIYLFSFSEKMWLFSINSLQQKYYLDPDTLNVSVFGIIDSRDHSSN